jgi:hypothetical protein
MATPRKPRSPKPDDSTNVEERIRQRAYELYDQRARADGFALNDWLQAEAEILALTEPARRPASR